MTRYKIEFEVVLSGNGDTSDVLDGITRMIDGLFPSGEFSGGTANVDEDTIAVTDLDAYKWIGVIAGWKCSLCGKVERRPYAEAHVHT